MPRFAVLVVSVVCLFGASVGPSAGRTLLPTAPGHTADFNGDNRSDLAIGSPGGNQNPGSVNVLYAKASGLSESNDQLWSQGSTDINGRPEAGDRFGHALSHADFDNDGFDDLAVGAPLEDDGDIDQGGVNVIYGSASGLNAAGDQQWTLDSSGVVGTANGDERFGRALAAGDFNGDGNADLAIGSNGLGGAGAVNILYGALNSGLQAGNNQQWTQASAGIPGGPEIYDTFGGALAVGDFNGDSYGDLAVGAPGENARQGVVHILYGSRAGLGSADTQLWSQDSPGISGGSEAGDRFGLEMAAGDFDGDGRSDLAIGAPGEYLVGFPSGDADPPHGSVNVLYGTASGLSATGQQLWSQASAGILGEPADGPHPSSGWGDGFGYALAAGDFNADNRADLAVGSPSDGFSGVAQSGSVNVIYGSSSGLAAAGNQIWTEASPSVPDDPHADWFGASLDIGFYNEDVYADLAVGAPLDDMGQSTRVGGVFVLHGGASGLTGTGSQRWWRNTLGVLGSAQQNGLFGFDLGAGHLEQTP